jgi:hypothetical protein
MEKSIIKIAIILSLVLSLPLAVGAQGILENIFTNIENLLYTLGFVVTIVFMIIGGYQMLTSAGDPKKFEQGKTTLLYAAIGFIVILIARSIVSWIKTELVPHST